MNPTENGTSFFIHYFSSVISQLISRAENIPQLETFSGHSPSYLPFYYVFRKFWLTSWAWNAEIYQNKEHRAQNILFSAEKKLKWNVDQSLSAEKWNSGISLQRHELINLQLLFLYRNSAPLIMLMCNLLHADYVSQQNVLSWFLQIPPVFQILSACSL